MALNSRSHYPMPPWGALFFALLGLVWCGYVAFPTGTSEPCFTSGCALTKSIRIGGISLWWVGGAYFFLQIILCLRGHRFFAWRLSQVALALDTMLLMVMLITGPCFDCLVIAFFFAATYFFLRPSSIGWFQEQKTGVSILLPFWLGLFIGNGILAINETTSSLTMYPKPDSEIRVYFAPSCPACRDALEAFGSQAVLYPVLENDEDFDSILRLQQFMLQGVPMREALTRSRNPEEPVPATSFLGRIRLHIGLARNKADVFKRGFTHMPLIEINGMPKAWLASGKKENPVSVGQSTTNASPRKSLGGIEIPGAVPDFLQIDDLKQCGQFSTEPCDE